jgi:hypothetical protein
MHFYCILKHENHVAKNDEPTQLLMKRRNIIRQSWAPLESNEKGGGFGHTALGDFAADVSPPEVSPPEVSPLREVSPPEVSPPRGKNGGFAPRSTYFPRN